MNGLLDLGVCRASLEHHCPWGQASSKGSRQRQDRASASSSAVNSDEGTELLTPLGCQVSGWQCTSSACCMPSTMPCVLSPKDTWETGPHPCGHLQGPTPMLSVPTLFSSGKTLSPGHGLHPWAPPLTSAPVPKRVVQSSTHLGCS